MMRVILLFTLDVLHGISSCHLHATRSDDRPEVTLIRYRVGSDVPSKQLAVDVDGDVARFLLVNGKLCALCTGHRHQGEEQSQTWFAINHVLHSPDAGYMSIYQSAAVVRSAMSDSG